MKNKRFINIIILLATALPVFGQFKTELPSKSFSELITSPPQTAYSLFDPNNIQMHQQFSMSFMTIGGQSMSVGAYTNSFSLSLSPTLKVNTQLSLVKPSVSFPGNTGQVYYGVGLDYRPTDNSLFSIKFNNYPTYYNRPNQNLYMRGH